MAIRVSETPATKAATYSVIKTKYTVTATNNHACFEFHNKFANYM